MNDQTKTLGRKRHAIKDPSKCAALEDRILTAIHDWICYYDEDVEFLGVSIDPRSLDVEICAEEECEPLAEWHPLEPLIDDGGADVDAVAMLAARIC